jgi:hypothetical protein
MLNNNRFYWSTIRRSVVAFGNMFNNIDIDRRDANGNVIQLLRVPLSYAPKQKFLARIAALPTVEERNVQINLPRMSFEMLGLQYDFNRKVSFIQQNRALEQTGVNANTQYVPTPYNMAMSLYLYAKNQDDGLQVIEQILPYFNPDYNLTFKSVPELNINNDMMIVLDSLNYEDQYEGDFSARRAIVWTLNFTVKLNFYGPVNKTGIIRRVFANTYSNPQLTANIERYVAEVSPQNANVLDTANIVVNENFTEF